ncbi:hypothetical protein APSETT444_004742 [Aspergillus pseudonomiae]
MADVTDQIDVESISAAIPTRDGKPDLPGIEESKKTVTVWRMDPEIFQEDVTGYLTINALTIDQDQAHGKNLDLRQLVDNKLVEYMDWNTKKEFDYLAAELTGPSEQDLADFGPKRSLYRRSPFRLVFVRLQEAAQAKDGSEASRQALTFLLESIIAHVDAAERLLVRSAGLMLERTNTTQGACFTPKNSI